MGPAPPPTPRSVPWPLPALLAASLHSGRTGPGRGLGRGREGGGRGQACTDSAPSQPLLGMPLFPSVAAPASSRPWGCGEQLGPSGAGPGPRPRSQDPAPHQEAACGAGHSAEPLEAAPAVSSCGLSHTGLRATCAAADAGRAFLDPVPCSREPRGGALMPRPGVLWVHPPSEAGGQENHRAQGRYTLLPTWARGPCRLPHTHLLCVSDSHMAEASHSGCSHDHPPAPRHSQALPVPKACFPHTQRTTFSPLGRSARVSSPLSCIAALSQAPSPSRSFIHSTNAH